MSIEELIEEIRQISGKCRWVILTGGEPALQVTPALVDALHEAGYKIAIETNGTRELPDGLDWVCVSPKTAEHTLRVKQCNELKYVRQIGQSIPQPMIKADYYFLSPAFDPEGLNPKALQHCIQLCKDNPEWSLTLQSHKLFGIR